MGRRTLIIMSVVCALWQSIPRLPISRKRRPKGVVQGSKPVCQCSATACHALSQVGSKGGRREGISRYEGQRYLWRLYRCNRMIPARP